MVTCPLCEHTQASGDECESCGRRLGAPREAPLALTPMAELEQTALVGGGAQVNTERLAELEATKLRAGPDLPPVAFPEMERTFAPPAAVDAPLIADLDNGRIPDDGVRTAVPAEGPVTCRYCRNVQAEGMICDKCGMRLTRVAVATAAVGQGSLEEVWVRCRCGAKALATRHCGNCGELVAAPVE